ncbi:amino acid ABC transporter substrate-binding protein [Undibacterium oligocarboniphilum]|uniref:Amino acid ABC transporter substrate-binding protein n=1 Tax=Undibacterium oligocarboniphilum TaxID=666702 RepID=A0A850QIL6_9BURK|nr:amino acid ABC transporter substrate-binding protein [Undibacterium oligocarboniphilum]MBC3871487.1 amino acid ABC transporter substrate-binding protein [Undibacterium oligocarboniphilum]NVO78937.1 amino acid ABC transporter substrate-binding protein [Undibacterium oligocarboniphilum]
MTLKITKLAILTALCLQLPGMAYAISESGSTLDKMRDSNTLVIGVRESAAPFAMMKNGVAQGYTVDLCRNVVAGIEKYLKTKLDIRYVPVNAKNRISLLQAGEIDMECGTTTDTRDREKEVAFTYPIFVTGARLAVRKDSPINDYSQLGGTRVVVVAGSSCEKLIQPVQVAAQSKGTPFSVRLVKDNNAGVLDVANHQADAFCTDDVLLNGAIEENNLNGKLHRVSRLLSIEPYALMIRKDDEQFLKLVDGIVAENLINGSAYKLVKKWFDRPGQAYRFNSMTTALFSFPNKTTAFP